MHDCSVTFALLPPPRLSSLLALHGLLLFNAENHQVRHRLDHGDTESGGPNKMCYHIAVDGTGNIMGNILVRPNEQIN